MRNAPPTQVIGYDENGEPIIRVVSEEIAPGTIFEHDEPEATQLVDIGVARHPTKSEVDLGKIIFSADEREAFDDKWAEAHA